MKSNVLERFWSKVDLTNGRCWLWTGWLNDKGYGGFYNGIKDVYAHRFAYELLIGPIPEGLGLDHKVTCPKHCVNPYHLRPATQKQNMENLATTNAGSGKRNVYWDARRCLWYVQVKHNQKRYFGGYFVNVEDADIAALCIT